MKCMSCGVEIPAEWVKVIEKNVCPNCEGQILNDAMQSLIRELGEALDKMPNDPQGIAGWLVSNYQMVKIGTGEPVTKFYGNKPQAKTNNEGVPVGLKIANNPLQNFYKNAGLKKSPEEYAAIAEKINSDVIKDYGDDEPTVNEDYIPEAEDPVYTAKVLSNMNQVPMNRRQIREMQQKMAQQNDDLDEAGIPVPLQQQRLERLRKAEELSLGGSIGKISRRE